MPIAAANPRPNPRLHRRASSGVDHAAETQLLHAPFLEEALPWQHASFAVTGFCVAPATETAPLFNVGCMTCGSSMASVLEAAKGELRLDLPSSFLTLPSFVYRLQIQTVGDEPWGKLRMIQRIYFAKDDVFVRDARFLGATKVDDDGVVAWDIAWPTNPFKARIDRGRFQQRDEPVRSDIFYFVNDRFLAHHRTVFRFVSPRVANAILLQRVEDNASLDHVHRALHKATFNRRGPCVQEATQLLHTAANHRACPTLQLLLAHGADINSVDLANHTVLHNAVQKKDFEMTRFFLKQGASVDGAVITTALTPLHVAIMGGSMSMVELLLDAGAAIGPACALRADPCDVQHCDHATALQCAYVWRQPEIASLLLRKGADVNDNRGAYPQHSILANCIMALHGDERMAHVLALLEHGAVASIHRLNKMGVSAMHFVVKHQLYAIAELFVHYQSSANLPMLDEAGLVALAVALKDRRMLSILGHAHSRVLPPDDAMAEEATYDAIGDHLALAKDMTMHFEANDDANNQIEYHQAALVSTVDNDAWMHEIRATGQITAEAISPDDVDDGTFNDADHGLVEAGDDGTMVVTTDEGAAQALAMGSVYDGYFVQSTADSLDTTCTNHSMVNAGTEHELVEAGDGSTMDGTQPDRADGGFDLGPIYDAYFRDDTACGGRTVSVGPIYDAYFDQTETLDDGSRVRFDEIELDDDDDDASPMYPNHIAAV
ncbi:hypothetical protein, variant [Saprolegnia diclina VS20]|uniref:Uncharacterized protein n=1 Tax=Saprolegnia diclina (strain VS20) TaxID=1156394 RepID=T0QRN0_SAPDV|nr:hypothetical protein, variant [Saprolegnia diclina VS20]EQC36600.1 hypothetical protein, variant [Saprolegnia diclina VS20]|eukprot:XP_008610020.1 hypothetical protein, variant [Saprolegnia diclina VS20]